MCFTDLQKAFGHMENTRKTKNRQDNRDNKGYGQ